MSAQASHVDLVFLARDLLDLLEPGQIEKESQSLFEEPRQEQRIVQRVQRIALQRTLKRGPEPLARRVIRDDTLHPLRCRGAAHRVGSSRLGSGARAARHTSSASEKDSNALTSESSRAARC
jgi:hypothetical protein